MFSKISHTVSITVASKMVGRNRRDKYTSLRKRKCKGFNGTPYHKIKKNVPCCSKTNNISNDSDDLAHISELVDNSQNIATTTVINENSAASSTDNSPLVHHQSHSTRSNSLLLIVAVQKKANLLMVIKLLKVKFCCQ